MLLPSPLGTLISVLQSVRLQAINNADLLKKNEAATRAALIDPILRALGWDTANVRMVEPEKTVNTAWRADYALHDAGGAIKLLVEAKCLGSNLEKFAVVQQLLGYAFGFGVPSIVMTDGISWHFYHNFKPGNSDSNSSFHLQQDDLTHCAFLLISWLDAAHFGHFPQVPLEYHLPVAQPVTQEPLVKSAPAVRKKKAATKPTSVASTATQDHFVDLGQVNTLQLQPGQKPTQLRLPDGSVRPVKSWKDILVKACEFVLENRPDLPIPFPDKAGKKIKLFAHQAFPTGIASFKTQYNGQPLFVYTNYSADKCLTNALYILSQLPKNKQFQKAAVLM